MEELPKLPKGEGSFSYKGSKIVYKKVVELPNGQRVRKSVTEDTVKACMKKMSAIEKKLLHGVKQENARMLSEAMYDWLYSVKRKELKDASYDRLEKTIRNQIEPARIGKMRYQTVTTHDVNAFISELIEKRLSHSTIKKAYDALNAFYKQYSVIDGFQNPVELVTLPKSDNVLVETKTIEFLEEDDIELFLKECDARYNTGTLKHKYAYVIGANIFLGLRIGELLALQWKDVDFERNTIYVCKTVVERNNRAYDKSDPVGMKAKGIKKVEFVVQHSTKRSKNRYVPVNEQARKLLLQHRCECEFTDADDFVISTRNRKITTTKNISDTIRSIEVCAGTRVQSYGTHVLRHTCASLYFRNGVPIETICAILGNSREVCEKTYVHFVEEQLKKAAGTIAIELNSKS